MVSARPPRCHLRASASAHPPHPHARPCPAAEPPQRAVSSSPPQAPLGGPGRAPRRPPGPPTARDNWAFASQEERDATTLPDRRHQERPQGRLVPTSLPLAAPGAPSEALFPQSHPQTPPHATKEGKRDSGQSALICLTPCRGVCKGPQGAPGWGRGAWERPSRPPSAARRKSAPHRASERKGCAGHAARPPAQEGAPRTRSTYPGAPVRTWVARR